MSRGVLDTIFNWSSGVIQARAAGHHRVAPDWLDRDALCWLALAPDFWELRVGLRHGVPPRALPARVNLGVGHPPLPVKALPGCAALAQSVPGLARTTSPFEHGTATCLVRDRLSPDRHYLLTCGHVLASSRKARWNDPVEINLAAPGGGSLRLEGRLREWLPAPGNEIQPTNIDAGLVEIDYAAVQRLREGAADWIPEAIDDRMSMDCGRSVVLKRCTGDLEGTITLLWSGEVELPDDTEGATYFLSSAVGYTTTDETVGGDSGAPVWTTSDALLGMHIGALDPEVSSGANAVMGLVAPVLDWYSVKPFTRDDPATLDARPRAGNSPRLPQPPAGSLLRTPPAALSDEEIQIVAKTLWGEARGEGKFGMEAVASVIVNRLRRKYRRCDTAAEVCLDPQQFSCWNSGDPNRAKMKALNNNSIDAEYRLALQVAAQALGGGLPDPTHGALHYVARTLRSRPNWLLGKTPCLVMGNHEFYNDVA